MQPVVAVTVGTACPPSNVALVEEVPQVQVSPLCRVFAPVACDAWGRVPSRAPAGGKEDERGDCLCRWPA